MTINVVEKLMTGSRKNRRRKLSDLANIFCIVLENVDAQNVNFNIRFYLLKEPLFYQSISAFSKGKEC